MDSLKPLVSNVKPSDRTTTRNGEEKLDLESLLTLIAATVTCRYVYAHQNNNEGPFIAD